VDLDSFTVWTHSCAGQDTGVEAEMRNEVGWKMEEKVKQERDEGYKKKEKE
jgi:hypothetical protein